MSANKKENTGKKPTELSGKVVLKKFGEGSKSEHDAVCLQTNKGDFVLRRVGGNPFHDEVLHSLVGKQVVASGLVENYTFFAKEINENDV
jgi:hypothetical protein